MSNDLWRWADPAGKQRRVRLDQLRAALAEGHIAPNAPVWRSGWTDWKPASEVPELTSATASGANGVVLNIPPPPLAMVAVQQAYEAASTSITPPPPGSDPIVEGEPPPPPAYVPIPAKPPSGRALPTQVGGSAYVPGSASAPPPAPGSSPSPARLGASLPTAIGLPPPPIAALHAARGANDPQELSGSMLVDDASSPNIGELIGPGGLPPPTNPVLHDVVTGDDRSSTADAGLPRGPFLNLILDDIAAIRQGQQPKNKRLLIVLGVVGTSLFVMLIAGVTGIACGPSSSSNKDTKVASASASASAESVPPPVAKATTAPTTPAPTPPPPVETKTGPVLGDCTVSGDAKTIAPRVVIASAVEAHALGNGLAFGFAAAPRDAMAVSLDPSSLAPSSTVHAKAFGDIRRVTPTLLGSRLTALPDVDRKGDRLNNRRVVPAAPLIDIGNTDSGIAWAPHGRDSIAKLFTVEGDGAIEALRATPLTDRKGIALTFRRGNAIHIGVAKGDNVLEAEGSLSKIAGLGQVGSPTIAASGEHVIVAWADRTGASDEWKVRWAKVKIGSTTEEATSFALPEGGLGGAAMSPSIAALGGGKFLLAWAEGPVSNHQVRALTIGVDGSPSGSPLAISGAGVNAGQPVAVVNADGRGAVAFVAAKGKSLEVHATPISCPR